MLKLPQDFIEKYQTLLGDEAEAFFKSLDEDVQKGFRINSLKPHADHLQIDTSHPIPFIKDGYYGTVSGRSLAHQAGYVYSQDISAMYVGQVVDAQPGETVLDLCAAPGGKSTHIAQQLNNQGLLVSNEINHKRASILVENLERFGAKNVIILNEDPSQLAQNLKQRFDKVVVDAPCSGEGMFRKDHNAIKYWHRDYPAECAARQRKILADAIQTLKPGGELIYSTCTFSPEEDEQIVSWLLTTYPDLELVEIPKFEGMDAGRPDFADGNPELAKTVRLMPHHFKGEGQFVAKLHLNGKPGKVKTKKKNKKQNQSQLTADRFALWQQTINHITNEWADVKRSNFKVFNNHLYYFDRDWPDIFAMKYMRPGLYLGEFKKKRFEPSYNLALTLNPDEGTAKVELSLDQWEKYMHGETVTLSNPVSNGWTLLTCEGVGFAFGKVVGTTVKNFIPKGLRFLN